MPVTVSFLGGNGQVQSLDLPSGIDLSSFFANQQPIPLSALGQQAQGFFGSPAGQTFLGSPAGQSLLSSAQDIFGPSTGQTFTTGGGFNLGTALQGIEGGNIASGLIGGPTIQGQLASALGLSGAAATPTVVGTLAGAPAVGGTETAAALGAQGLGDVGATGTAGVGAGAVGAAFALPFLAGALSDPHFLEGSFFDLGGLFGGHTQGSHIDLPGVAPGGFDTRTAGGTRTALASFAEGQSALSPFETDINAATSLEGLVAALNQRRAPFEGQFRVESHGPGFSFGNLSPGYFPGISPFTTQSLQNPDVLRSLNIHAGMMGAPAQQPDLEAAVRQAIQQIVSGNPPQAGIGLLGRPLVPSVMPTTAPTTDLFNGPINEGPVQG